MNKGKIVMLENRSFFLVTSDEEITINEDNDSPSFLSNIELENDSGDFELTSSTGSIKNISGRNIKLLTGSISFQPNKGGGLTSVMHLWSERSSDGITWTQNSHSLRVIEISNSGETFKTNVSYINNFLNQEHIRFRAYIYSGGSVTLVPPTDTVLNGNVIKGHSVIWKLKEA